MRGNRVTCDFLSRGDARGNVFRCVFMVRLPAGWAVVTFAAGRGMDLGIFIPSAHKVLKSHQSISFYLWSFSLTIVVGKTVSFIMQQDSKNYGEEFLIAFAALLLCIGQFAIGRWIGRRHGETIAGGQGLGQKNTILAIWMAQVYLSPLSSIGPAAYVLWQNSINSWQLWKKRKREGKV